MEVDHSGNRLAATLLAIVALFAAAPVSADQFRIVSHNLNRFFDDVEHGNDAPAATPQHYRQLLALAVEQLTGNRLLPHLIALQEIENASVLRRLAAEIKQRHGIAYRPVMAANTGASPINTGYLVHPALVIRGARPLFIERRFANTEPLFTRPPLQLDACLGGRCLRVLNLHLRSMRGIRSKGSAHRVASKRRYQAQTLARWIDRQQDIDPALALLVLGDFNALTPSDRYVDVAGIVRGNPDNARTRFDSPDLIERDLQDLTRRIPPQRRYSYIYRGKKQQLDYLFANQPLAAQIEAIHFDRIDYALSDHAALFARFRWP